MAMNAEIARWKMEDEGWTVTETPFLGALGEPYCRVAATRAGETVLVSGSDGQAAWQTAYRLTRAMAPRPNVQGIPGPPG
jgi:hypothetical protein